VAVGRKRKRPVRTWSEQDLYTSWRHLLVWKPGVRRWTKRQTHKFERRQGKGDALEDRDQ
jgi:hypothetical protein